MKVHNIVDLLKMFNVFLPDSDNIDFKYSSPWNFHLSESEKIPFEHTSGVFILCDNDKENWNVPITENENDLLYIGKADHHIDYTILHTLRHSGQDRFPVLGNPPFNNHKWKQSNIPKKLKEKIKSGDITMYSILLLPVEFNIETVYAYLLNCFFNATGNYPPLNEKKFYNNL